MSQFLTLRESMIDREMMKNQRQTSHFSRAADSTFLKNFNIIKSLAFLLVFLRRRRFSS
jgi:hypothetical protein